MTITAEGLFSVSYTSTRMGNIATGFNMSISGPSGSIDGKKTVKVSNGEQSGTWGTDSGVVLSKGNRVSRNYEGDSSVVVDPIYDLFQKLVFFKQMDEGSFSDKVKGSGNFVSLTVHEVEVALREKLGAGDIKGFLEMAIQPPGHINISYDKIGDSPVIQALKGNTSYGKITENTINASMRMFSAGTMMSVGDIFTRFIAPLGLELYWESSGHYSLEPPRLSMNNPSPVMSISRKDIIDLRITTDPYNAPDIVIPSMVLGGSIGIMAHEQFVIASLEGGVLGKMGGKNLRVSTYDIPDFLSDPVMDAVKGIEKNCIDNYSGGVVKQASEDTAIRIARFYGAHSRKSSLYSMKSGECTMVLRPDIVKAYNWYTIDGQLCFVSDIRHQISRGSAMTILTIAGINDEKMSTSGLVGMSPSKVPEIEDKMIDQLNDKANSETNTNTESIKKGQKKTESKAKKRTPKDMNKIFGDYEANQSELEGTSMEKATNFEPGDE